MMVHSKEEEGGGREKGGGAGCGNGRERCAHLAFPWMQRATR